MSPTDDMEILIAEDMPHYVTWFDRYLRANGIDVTERNEDLMYHIWGFRTQLTQCIWDASDFLQNYEKKRLLMIVDGRLPFTNWGRVERTGWQWIMWSAPRNLEELALFPFSSDDDNNENMKEALELMYEWTWKLISPHGKSKSHQYPGLLEFLQKQ